MGYGKFKEDLAEVVVERLRPVQERFNAIRNDKEYLEKVYTEGAQKPPHWRERRLEKYIKKLDLYQDR